MKPTTKDAYRLLHDGSIALAEVESNGIRIDTRYLENAIKTTSEEIEKLDRELQEDEVYKVWYKTYGDKTNLQSRPQLNDILFNKLGYKPTQFTETGLNKVDKSVLDGLDIPFARKYIEVAELRKVRATYLYGIRNEMVDGYIHPFFDLHTTVTGRGSSQLPNFQNIPNRNPRLAGIVRRCFIPRKNSYFAEDDYSGIEVKMACCYTKDPRLIDEFTTKGKDPHRDTACQLFFLEPEQVEKKTTRDWAKNRFVFPQFYGSVYFQCAPHIWEVASRKESKLADGTSILRHLRKNGIKKGLGECTPGQRPVKGTFKYHVQQIEEDFWKRRFKVYTDWKRAWFADYRDKGWFESYIGFRWEGIFTRNQVLNYPMQESGFHCLLWSIIRVQRWLKKNKMKTKILGQIHDSIIADVHKSEVQDYLTKTKEVLTKDLPKAWEWIIVPLETESELSETNWLEKKLWTEKNGVWQKN